MIIVGIDEVGRGCWAGPLVVGAVAFSHDFDIEDRPIVLRDSKKMSKKQRELAASYINEHALAVELGWVSASEIDAHGLTEAVRVAMERAFAKISIDYDEIIIDGNINYFPANPKARSIIKADDSILAVSAASIVAKVARDSYMNDLGIAYAGYGFEKHVGYGTAMHIVALKNLGVSDIHRRSYKPIKALLV